MKHLLLIIICAILLGSNAICGERNICDRTGTFHGYADSGDDIYGHKEAYLSLSRKLLSISIGYKDGRTIFIESRPKCSGGRLLFSFNDDGWGHSGSGFIQSHKGHLDLLIKGIRVRKRFPPGLPSEITSMYGTGILHLFPEAPNKSFKPNPLRGSA